MYLRVMARIPAYCKDVAITSVTCSIFGFSRDPGGVVITHRYGLVKPVRAQLQMIKRRMKDDLQKFTVVKVHALYVHILYMYIYIYIHTHTTDTLATPHPGTL